MFTNYIAAALFLAAPMTVLAQAATEAACPSVALFPVASTDGSSIGVVSQCAKECLQNANACVCGASNPFADRSCICAKDVYENDFVGCASYVTCAATADIALFRKFKADFCAGTIQGPAGGNATVPPATSAVAGSTVVPITTAVISATVGSSVAVTTTTGSVAVVTGLPSSIRLSTSAGTATTKPTTTPAAAGGTNPNGAVQNGAMLGSGAVAAVMGVLAAL
ncbi:hypothetical protein PhCBS80983_g05668 [Powellomyces hirtus]|uniref:Extracellular membrane protein CFEM domain-containing protein n=1 Tax=Powellomyces hirtus TaxID=109895 RepID=A0A507DT73_9FUNG|nr:hypothetical protein PhCBS80983_g05668 [Powellomyces hirtus]